MIKGNTSSIFDVLRDEFHLDFILSVNGNRKAPCVAHEEKTPSMHVYEDHAHCFGCGFHGDVIDVWGKLRGIDRPIEAALDLAREYNVRVASLEMSEEARKKAEKRREREESALDAAKKYLSMAEEKKKNAKVREWWEGRGFGAELRERFLLGALGPTEASIPFWHRGRVKSFITRHLEGEPKYYVRPAHMLPDGYKPLFIPGPIQNEAFLVEGFVDALALAAIGRSAIAVGGTRISERQAEDLAALPVDRFYVLPDKGNEGAEAALEWARRFYPNARICDADYGTFPEDDDIAAFFARHGAEATSEHLGRLVSASKDILDVEMEKAAEIGDRRERLAYVSENIVPLLTPLRPLGYRDATTDIVAETCKLKKSWLLKAIEDDATRRLQETAKKMVAEAEAEVAQEEAEYRARVAEVQSEIDELLAPGALARLRDAAARMHHVHGDREPLELAILVALGAQLDPLPNGRPLGASILLTATAGRGKNHIVDAAVEPLPPEFYFSFEIASGQSLYYMAEQDPEFLKHTFAYPNEIEGAEALWEFLRPMLSKGSAKKIVTAKDSDGNMIAKTIIVEGPTTIAIPTIRNKTDEQLQTRLLVAELPDYVGRVKDHSHAISEQFLPDAATADHSHEKWLWREGLRALTQVRRVVFPLGHPDFALDDDQISHGARLWANLLSLMATAAWLEQHNRRVLDLGDGRLAVEATPDDYETAYRIFNKVCKRTVVNISDTHRKILDGLHTLMEDYPERYGFRQREIAEAADVSLGAVSNHKTFLVTSAKLMKEGPDGLALVEGADPSWWATGEMMEGLPTPEQVRTWWEERDPDPPEPGEHGEHVNTDPETGQEADAYGDSPVHGPDEHGVNTFMNTEEGREQDERVHGLFTEDVNTENGLGTANGTPEGGDVHVFTPFTGSGEDEGDTPPADEPGLGGYNLSEFMNWMVEEGPVSRPAEEPKPGLAESAEQEPNKGRRLTKEEAARVQRLIREGMLPRLAREAVLAKRGVG